MAIVKVPKSIERCYLKADVLALRRYPYVFGGGHPGFIPSSNPLGTPLGYDCSGWCSSILHTGGILGSTYALDTWALADWGESGRGEFMTLWVINVHGVIEHCFMEFTIPGRLHRWSVAPHTGTICGWQSFMPTLGYTPRRRKK